MLDAFKAVFWSFFGVRKQADHDSDARKVTPVQVIVAGLVSALVFVLAIFFLVKAITR
jgi:hypothetical protein